MVRNNFTFVSMGLLTGQASFFKVDAFPLRREVCGCNLRGVDALRQWNPSTKALAKMCVFVPGNIFSGPAGLGDVVLRVCAIHFEQAPVVSLLRYKAAPVYVFVKRYANPCSTSTWKFFCCFGNAMVRAVGDAVPIEVSCRGWRTSND